MKKMRVLLVAALLLAMCAFSIAVSASEDIGMTFTAEDYYFTAKNITTFPKTYEATVCFPKDMSTSATSVIFGNSGDSSINVTSFQVTKDGYPQIYIKDVNHPDQTLGVPFSNVSLFTGEKTHVAITVDNGNYKCYINGELVQTIPGVAYSWYPLEIDSPMYLGGDIRDGNTLYFKGTIYDVAIFDEVRTADEIALDYACLDYTDESLMAAYDVEAISDGTMPLFIEDKSANGINLVTSSGGLDFTADQYYVSKNNLTVFPKTYEATIYFPEDMESSTAGVIFGNAGDASINCTSFQVFANGHPGFYIRGIGGDETLGVAFSDVNVYNGKKTHLAITVGNGSYKCYVDGVLAQTINGAAFSNFSVDMNSTMFIAGDFRDGNTQYFKGIVYDIAIFDDIRTADEIEADFQGVAYTDESLIAAYELGYDKNGRRPSVLSDKSTNRFDFDLETPWIYEKEAVTDYDYSMAVVGDIQTITYYYPDKLHHIFDWICDNAGEKKMSHAFVLGDITDKDLDSEYELAKPLIQQMDEVVPYTLVRGNHDSKEQYNKYFTYDEFENVNGGSYDGTMLNTYQFFNVGDTKFMSLALDIGAGDDVLAWASEVIEENPDTNVIVSTHIYMNSDGSLMTEGVEMNPVTWYGGEKYADETWTDFLSQHENIVLVLCGHISTDTIVVRQDKGVNGNTVTQILVDPQKTDKTIGACGLVAMLYFKNDGKTVEVEYYSTVNEAYFLEENQFTFEIDLVDTEEETPEQDEVSIESITLLDASYNEIDFIPDSAFYAQVALTNNTYSGFVTVIVTTYDADGRMLGTDFLYADPDKEKTVTFGTQISNSDGKVAKIKAMAVSNLKSLKVLTESVEITK